MTNISIREWVTPAGTCNVVIPKGHPDYELFKGVSLFYGQGNRSIIVGRARYNWVKSGNPISLHGAVMIHIDGNLMNDDLSNLQVVTKSVYHKFHSQMKKMGGYECVPTEFARTLLDVLRVEEVRKTLDA